MWVNCQNSKHLPANNVTTKQSQFLKPDTTFRPPLYVTNFVEDRYTRTEPANMERVFHGGQISAARLNSRQQG